MSDCLLSPIDVTKEDVVGAAQEAALPPAARLEGGGERHAGGAGAGMRLPHRQPGQAGGRGPGHGRQEAERQGDSKEGDCGCRVPG